VKALSVEEGAEHENSVEVLVDVAGLGGLDGSSAAQHGTHLEKSLRPGVDQVSWHLMQLSE